jgi:hypothetical protein
MIYMPRMGNMAKTEETKAENGMPPLEPVTDVSWSALIPPEQWAVYERVIKLAEERGIPFALGGGLAFSHYANRWRNTKDMDLYVRPEDKDAMIAVVHEMGLRDYFEVHDYDRAWIYRSHNGEGIIVDIIWQMANYRAQVDDGWLKRGDLVRIHGWPLRLLPAEELIWAKLYVMQRERCDWGDLLNILFSRAPQIDWAYLLARVGEDKRVVAALAELFTWACPDRARHLPVWLWGELGIESPPLAGPAPEIDTKHIRMLDSRDWFGPNQESVLAAQHFSRNNNHPH